MGDAMQPITPEEYQRTRAAVIDLLETASYWPQFKECTPGIEAYIRAHPGLRACNEQVLFDIYVLVLRNRG